MNTVGRVARVALAGAIAATGIGAAGPANLDIDIGNIRSAKGNILVCVTSNPHHFPDCRKDAQARRLVVPAAHAAVVTISDLAPGDYAIALIHDENANGKLDTRLMIPSEGFGFSRNPPIGFGPPRFKVATFALVAGRPEEVRMKYML